MVFLISWCTVADDVAVLLFEDHAPPKPRDPLPPFPPGNYQNTLPWTPPANRDFLRADAWGVTIPGLPFVPGGSSRHPERCLSWFLDRWDAGWQSQILKAHVERGYTHFYLSWPDSRAVGTSLDGFVSLCNQVKTAGLFPHVKLASKDFDQRDQSAAQWAASLDPVMDALAGIAAEYGVWEWNFFNIPGQTTIDTFKYIGQKAHSQGATFWMHFSTEVTSWFANGDPRGRFGFYDDIGTDVDGLDYQTSPTWDIPMLQARIVDSLSQFGRQGNRHKFRLFEDSASLMFDNDQPDEDHANLRCYLGCCTTDNVTGTDAKVWGFGNGGRKPDGSVL